jgi:hypothetical protein
VVSVQGLGWRYIKAAGLDDPDSGTPVIPAEKYAINLNRAVKISPELKSDAEVDTRKCHDAIAARGATAIVTVRPDRTASG